MKVLRDLLDRQAKMFEKGGKLEKLFPLWEANDTFLYTPGEVTHGAAHVRDALDLKRMMSVVVISLFPCILIGIWNIGYQANLQLASGQVMLEGWRASVLGTLEIGYDPKDIFACFFHGLLYYLPISIITVAIGGNIEALFSIIRKHDINEGFLVTWMLFPLILPATIPLWQVAIGIAFGVLIKEVFGGTGMNIFNPALTARVFLFFAYPAQISGDKVWFAVNPDGFSGPTMLSQVAEHGMKTLQGGDYTWIQAFLGAIPGSIGETSALACLLGAVVLILSRVASFRTMGMIVVGSLSTSLLLNAVSGHVNNPLFAVPFYWHMVLGGWAFGAVFMATDPVSSAFTKTGQLFYGFGIGMFAILIRVLNPAYPEGMMLAILFMNVFAATIDHYVVKANIKRRMARNGA